MSAQNGKRTRRIHTRRFKADTVALVRKGGRSVPQVANELGLANSLVYDWCRQAEVDEGKGAPGALTTAEKEELSHLRRKPLTGRVDADGWISGMLGTWRRTEVWQRHRRSENAGHGERGSRKFGAFVTAA